MYQAPKKAQLDPPNHNSKVQLIQLCALMGLPPADSYHLHALL